MKLLFDLHTHTISSGHAYSTLSENIAQAKKVGLLAYGVSEHSQSMPGSVDNLHFSNYKVVPSEFDGMKFFAGVEANIMDYNGNIDCTEFTQSKVEYIIASLHPPCIKYGTIEQNTSALIGAMQNPRIKIIGHPDDSRYPFDLDKVVKEAIKTKTILEINNSSLAPKASREGGLENIKNLLKKCKEYKAKVIVNTDSHFHLDVGNFDLAIKVLKEMNFPQELVVNATIEGLKDVIN